MSEWRLVTWDPTRLKEQPTDEPPPQAELCGNGGWKSLFIDHVQVACWVKLGRMTDEERAALRRRAQTANAGVARRPGE